MTRPRSIMWFRRDLRLDDHPALAEAAESGDVVPLYVVDPAFAGAGVVRLAHRHDALVGLDAAIRERAGSVGLTIRTGRPAEVVAAVAQEAGASTVFVTRDHTPYGRRRDVAVRDALAGIGVRLVGVGSPYAVMPGSVLKDDGDPYAVFTPFSRRWRATGWDQPEPTPDDIGWVGAAVLSGDPLPARPATDIAHPPAGPEAAHDLWASFRDERLDTYPDDRDRPAIGGTSQLSPALKWGTIHPRTLLADLDPSVDATGGHATFVTELAWREFYADVLHHQPRTAWENLRPEFDAMPVDTDDAARGRFERWQAGTTGFGLVDAGMRQLLATGWMHNRVRMVTASFLVKDLHLPWQWGARWFMERLIDGDLASNNHNWQWVAGSGTDAAPYFRIFNPDTQQRRFDPDGEYVGRWVGDHSDPPMLDHRVEREEALRRLETIR